MMNNFLKGESQKIINTKKTEGAKTNVKSLNKRMSQIKGKESENSYQELKRSPKDRHTQTHGNCIEIFRQARPSFSIGRE